MQLCFAGFMIQMVLVQCGMNNTYSHAPYEEWLSSTRNGRL